jgi:MFS superfamily sulfate permease-like transporter
MLAAIGLILILNPVPHLLGDDSSFVVDETIKQSKKGNIFSNFFYAFTNINRVAMIIGVVCLAFTFLWEKIVAGRKGFIRFVPAPLLVVLMGVGINMAFGGNDQLTGQHLVNIPKAENAGEFFSFFSTPNWSNILNKDVWIIAVTLALVASLETLLSIEAIDDLDPYQRVTNKERELKAQGVGNMLSGLIGGLPLTSVIVRSSANVNAGAQSKLSTIFHGLLLLGSVALIPTLLNLIPKAALAAILIATGYKLAKPALFRHFYKMGMNQFIPFVVTIVAILITDLLIGVLIGMAVGLFFVIRSNFRSSVFVVNDESQYLFRLRKDVSFLNKPIVKNRLEEVPENASVLIDVSRADFIDRDVVETIEDFMIHAPLKNITVSIRHSPSRNHGFNEKVRNEVNPMPDLIREHEKNIKVVEPQ